MIAARRSLTAAAALIVAGLLACPAAPRAADLSGWGAAKWGMTQGELDKAFGASIGKLPGRWQYGGAYADRAILNVPVAGQRFIAFFQMNESTDRLQQVLLERQPQQSSPAAYDGVLAALEKEYGVPTAQCPAQRGAAVRIEEARWVFPTTTVHVAFLDFFNRDLLFEDPNRDRDIREPSTERQRINPASLPRRVLIRFHPTVRADLMRDGDCMSRTTR